jgi:hypothetical protein
MPALAAAGLVWHAKDMLSNDQQGLSMLDAQPSILNFYDLPQAE